MRDGLRRLMNYWILVQSGTMHSIPYRRLRYILQDGKGSEYENETRIREMDCESETPCDGGRVL